MPRANNAVTLTREVRLHLEAIARSRSMPHGLVRRAQIVLGSADGLGGTELARRHRVSRPTVSRWCRRWRESGLAGLHTELRPGRPRSIDDEQASKLLTTALKRKLEGQTHWSVRSLAAETSLSPTSVHRCVSLFGLQSHRSKSFKLSNDPFFVEKVHDIVGLYLNPPENALVLCVDEKSQCQALERTQPVLPMGLGYAEGITHDYKRQGTTTLFAALDVANGEVLAQRKRRHRHQEFLAFLRHIDQNVPAGLNVHLICDNYGTHKHQRVRAWLARRPRYQVHYTPTYASWLNQVERWFGLITQRANRRGSFKSVPDLIGRIKRYTEYYNLSARPFVWTATADSILVKIKRLCKVIGGTQHQQADEKRCI